MPPKVDIPTATNAAEQKSAPEPVKTPDRGPNMGERGEYLPATYTTQRGSVREDR